MERKSMSYAQDAAALLLELGEYMNDPLIRLENGRCDTELEGISFSFSYSEEFSALFIQADMGNFKNIPEPAAALEQLMLRNHLWQGTAGGVFGLHPKDDHLYYNHRLDFPLSSDPLYRGLLVELLPVIIGALKDAAEILTQKVQKAQDAQGAQYAKNAQDERPCVDEPMLRV
jgi:hypothetical protein